MTRPKLGSGERFRQLKSKIARRGGVRDPGAVAAAVGRKKYGKERMQEMAAAGKRRASKKPNRAHQLSMLARMK